MNSDEMKPETQSQRRPRLQFSLLALLILMTLVCVALSWWTRPRPVKVIALLVVNSQQTGVDGDLLPWEMVQLAELSRLKDVALIRTVLRDAKVAKLPLVMETSDPASWLRDNLSVKFEQSSEILSVTLSVLSNRAADAQTLLNAYVGAYLKDAVVAEQQQRQLKMQKLQADYDATSAEVKALSQQIAKLRTERGPEDPEAKLLQVEADRKVESAGILTRRLSLLQTTRPQINLVQPATVTGN
jgi:hypothetical protein